MGPRRPALSTAGRRAGPWVVAAVAVSAAGLAACGAADHGRSSSSSASSGGSIPAALVREARPIGRGARFQPPARGPVIGPCRRALGRARGVHVEVFAANRVVLIPAGIGTKPPRATFEGRISKARCFGDLVTLEPTGVVLVRSGVTLDPRRPVQVLGPAAVTATAGLVRRGRRSARGRIRRRPAVAREAGRRTAASPRGDRARGRPARTPAQLVHVPAGNLTVQIILLSSSFSDLRVGRRRAISTRG